MAAEARLEDDDALILLWDAGFDYVTGPGDVLARGEANRARRALGLATRRELASPEYWIDRFDIDEAAFNALMHSLGLVHPYSGRQLTKKAQHRLRTEARARALFDRDADAVRVEAPEPTAPLIWEIIGHERDCEGVSSEQVRKIHQELVADFSGSGDPIAPSGVKSAQLLDSAVHRPQTSNGGIQKYPTVEMGAAALLHALVHNHPFHNGNKRTALVATIVFLDANGLVLTADEDELFKLVLQLAQHALVRGERADLPDREILEVARWLKSRVRWKEKGDRAVTWRELRRLLVARGCEIETAAKGQRTTITRRVSRGYSWLGRPRDKMLSVKFTNVRDGRDVDPNVLKRLRRELELDEDHGIDSATFYADAALSTSDFVQMYQGILRRLANV